MADDPQQSPFLQGLMSGLSGTNPLVNAGFGLMAAARPYGNVGESLLQSGQVTQQNRLAQQQAGMQQLQMQKLQAMMPMLQQYYKGVGGMFSPQPQQASPDTAPPSAPGGVPSQMPGMGIDPGTALNLGTMGAVVGAPGAAELAKYPENYTKVQEALQTQKKMQLQGPMALLKSVASSPEADAIVQNDPKLMAQFTQDAPHLGVQALTPQTARTWAAFAHNNLAGPAGVATIEMPHPLVSSKGPNGQINQTDPVSNKTDVAVPAQSLTPVVGQGGLPTLTPSGKAAGKQPFNEQIYGANQISDPALERGYQTWKATGAAPSGQGRNVLAQAKQANYIAQRADQEGVPEQAAAARQQAFKAQQAVLDDFTNPSGKAGGSLVAINTAVSHFQSLLPLIDAMQNGNMTLINKARQEFQKQTGQPAPTNYQALADMASGEASKAITANGGSVAEREDVASPFKSANGPEALKGAVQTVSTALAGKTDALRNSWEATMQGTQGDFNKFLMPATKKQLGIEVKSSHPANIQALIDKYAGKANGGS